MLLNYPIIIGHVSLLDSAGILEVVHICKHFFQTLISSIYELFENRVATLSNIKVSKTHQ